MTSDTLTPLGQKSSLPAETSNPLRLIAVALLLGWSVDFLFYGKALGISFPIFIALGALMVLGVAILQRVRPALGSLWLLIPMVAFSALVAVRAEPLTTFVNIATTLALGLLWARTFRQGGLFRFGLLDYAVNYVLAGIETLIRPLSVLASASKQASARENNRRMWMPIARGLLIATPILCLFALLLSAADLVFADRLRQVLETLKLDNLPELIQRLVLILAAAYLAIGVFAAALRNTIPYLPRGDDHSLVPCFLGGIESGIVLGSTNLLFAAFVAIQFRYLFGSTANITEAGFTYSEYARRGFGELVLVVAITLLILLALSAIVRRETRAAAWLFNALNVVMVGLVGVMVVSALQRLLLYEAIFGFTRLRTYSHVAIIWLGLLFVPYLLALLTGHMRRFATGALFVVIGFGLTLNALNVDRFIAVRNIDYYKRNGTLHTNYLITLSDDALPKLLPLLNSEDPEVLKVLGPGLACRADQMSGDDSARGWQSNHAAHQTAREQLRSLQSALTSWHVYYHAYDGSFVYVDGQRTRCATLLQSFVLEPGLTSEYR